MATAQKEEVRENLFTKKAEKVFFQQARDEAEAAGKVAVLLKGFDNHEKNMILDDRAMKIKNANKEHTIIVRSFICRWHALACHAVSCLRCYRTVLLSGPIDFCRAPRALLSAVLPRKHLIRCV